MTTTFYQVGHMKWVGLVGWRPLNGLPKYVVEAQAWNC